MNTQGRLPAIDGLRTAAVLAVFAYHIDEPLVPGGYVGVDAFFVISGFVITSLLMREARDRGRINLGQFYLNRLWRLAPALLTMTALTTLYLAATGRLDDAVGAIYAVTYTMNFQRMVPGTDPSLAFGHTWSLGVEEQFYLAWPLVVGVALRAGRGSSDRAVVRFSVAGVAVAALCSLGLVLVFGNDKETQNIIYNSPITRGCQLLLGGALAGWSSSRRPLYAPALRWPPVVAVLGLGVWALAVPVGQYFDWAVVTLPVVGLLAVVVVMGASDATTPVGRVLGHAALAAAGRRYSYAFYLWHYPLIYLLRPELPGRLAVRAVVVLAATGVAAALTHHLVEVPVARRRRSAEMQHTPVEEPT